MNIADKIRKATFLQRLNRFSALVDTEGGKEPVYLANSGRMEELLQPGRTVLLEEKSHTRRKTSYDLIMVAWGEKLVSVDARVPGRLVYEALVASGLPHFHGYSSVHREATIGRSRLDFLLTNHSRCFLEVKSVTLVRHGKALFPDAPTLRGRRHLRELSHAREQGDGAGVIFVIQREDAVIFSPHDEMDPKFGRALRDAQAAGVAVYAYRCRVSPQEVALAGEIPVLL